MKFQATRLTEYLNDHFYTRSQLLTLAKLDESSFARLLDKKIMPGASYRMKTTLALDSFFGEHRQEEERQYYARGYLSWLQYLGELEAEKADGQDIKAIVFADFCSRYQAKLTALAAQGFHLPIMADKARLDALLLSEWQHFLNGTYGLCTRSGLPEDIAAKELAIVMIKAIVGEGLELDVAALAPGQSKQLTKAVDLLDQASSAFAPHEVKRSSRELYINRVRLKYKLS
ncbi:DUF6058 family natural product biosynthesis protein [Thalassomonas actiniarum]|uniref:Uncharacterized protein n=1 Tax=Thalassomonas actiniarum TaxID=485447 RepID=A0AAF0C5D4_9GAMM|nr:DUF6058 family natural product biosynthesis protein [Thalassomonas actiniarum]WDE00976.1 hypothetical protein SG35_010290 [Thalassomonas actiniarum]